MVDSGMSGERSHLILKLVAEAYISSARPIPSSGIATRLQISSATVRNEFNILEEQGFLYQPHPSSGRVPTAKGFQAYARHFIPPRRLPFRDRQFVSRRLSKVHGESLLGEIATVAADLSSYAVVLTLPADDNLRTIEVHLSLLSSRRLLGVIVLENGLVRQISVDLDPVPNEKIISDAERHLRKLAIPVGIIPQTLVEIAKNTDRELARTLQAVARAWPEATPDRLYSQGLTNLLAEPESRDPDFVRIAVEKFEAPHASNRSDDDQLTLQLDDTLAAISAQLHIGSSRGILTLLGPARMRYPEALMIALGVSQAATENLSLGQN
jgi:heat-inducible transcriptional repressor